MPLTVFPPEPIFPLREQLPTQLCLHSKQTTIGYNLCRCLEDKIVFKLLRQETISLTLLPLHFLHLGKSIKSKNKLMVQLSSKKQLDRSNDSIFVQLCVKIERPTENSFTKKMRQTIFAGNFLWLFFMRQNLQSPFENFGFGSSSHCFRSQYCKTFCLCLTEAPCR